MIDKSVWVNKKKIKSIDFENYKKKQKIEFIIACFLIILHLSMLFTLFYFRNCTDVIKPVKKYNQERVIKSKI